MAFDGERLVQSKYEAPQRNMKFAAACAYLGGLSFGYMIGKNEYFCYFDVSYNLCTSEICWLVRFSR